MKYIGHIPKQYDHPGSHISPLVDQPVLDEILRLKMPYDANKYFVIRGTLEGIRRSIRKYDKPNFKPDLDWNAWHEAKVRGFEYFRPHADTCPEASEEELFFKRDASAGAYFKFMHGVKKVEGVLDSDLMIEECRKFHADPQFPTLHLVAGKQEMLPYEKVVQNKPRTFIISDFREQYHTKLLTHHQHELFKRLALMRDSYIACGRSFQYGGFNEILSELKKWTLKGEGDCSEWDSSLIQFVFEEFIIPIRTELYEPPRYKIIDGKAIPLTVEEREADRLNYREKLVAIYKDMLEAVMVMPDGEVIQKFLGMCSGFFLTTDDNTLFHLAIVFYLEALVKARGTWRLYSDDHIFGTEKGTFEDFELRRKVYGSFGVTLKPAADRVSEEIEGLSFLGFTAKYHEGYDMLVPVYNVEKALSSLVKPDGRYDDLIRYIRISALRVVCYFTQYRDEFRKLASKFYQRDFATRQNPFSKQMISDDEFYRLAQFPTDRAIESLWLGLETQCRGGKRNEKMGRKGKKKAAKVVEVIETKNHPPVMVVKKSRAQKKGSNTERRKTRKRPAGPTRPGRGLNTATGMGSDVGQTRITHTIHGKGLVMEVRTNAVPPTQATVLSSVSVNPLSLLPDDRLAKFAPLYEKFKVDYIEVTYVNDVSQQFSGDVMCWYEANPLVPWTEGGLPLSQRVSDQQYRLELPVCKSSDSKDKRTFLKIPAKAFANAKDYRYFIDPETAPDQTTCFAGKLFFGVKGPLVANTFYGTFYIDWKITFFNDARNQDDIDAGSSYVSSSNGTGAQINPLAAPWNFSGKAPPVTVTATGSVTSMVFSELGIYTVSCFSQGTGGAALTNTTTTTQSGANVFQAIVRESNTQTQKNWWYVIVVAAPGAVVTFADSAGTHPNGAYTGAVTLNRQAVPALTRSDKAEITAKYNAASLELRMMYLEQKSGHLRGMRGRFNYDPDNHEEEVWKRFLPTLSPHLQNALQAYHEYAKQVVAGKKFRRVGHQLVPELATPGTATVDFQLQDGNNTPPSTLTGTMSIGTLDVVVVDPIPPKSFGESRSVAEQVPKKKEKKFKMVEMPPSDDEDRH